MLRTLFPCALLLAASLLLASQSVRHTVLAVRVEPQVELNVRSAPLRFVIAEGAAGEVTGGTVTLLAKARPGPGQRARLTVAAEGVPASEIRWRGVRGPARGGASVAECAGGALAGAGPRVLAVWSGGGVLACSVTFSLPDASRFTPGVYTGTARFDLRLD